MYLTLLLCFEFIFCFDKGRFLRGGLEFENYQVAKNHIAKRLPCLLLTCLSILGERKYKIMLMEIKNK